MAHQAPKNHVGWPTANGGLCFGLEVLWTNATGNTEREKMCINLSTISMGFVLLFKFFV